MTEQEIINKISKPATLFKVGGFRPSEEISSSWFGKVLLKGKEENWPEKDGKYMTPLCQLNLSNLPYKPDSLKDIDFITIFIDQENIFNDNKAFLVRTYKSIDELTSLNQIEYSNNIKPFQLEPYLDKNDCPSWDDCTIDIPDEFEDDYENLFENKLGIKIGGWPSLVQGEIFWESDEIEYVFQISSVEKANWSWGDGGVGYFGKNSKTDKWSLEWQCY